MRVRVRSPLSFATLRSSSAEKRAAPNQGAKDKETEELDQVVGNAEDEIGDRISGMRETELLYGPDSLLSVYGPMIVHICGSPHKFKVSALLTLRCDTKSSIESNSARGRYTGFQQIPVC